MVFTTHKCLSAVLAVAWCPSVRPSHVLYPDSWRYCQTYFSTRYPNILVFWLRVPIPSSNGNLSVGRKIHGVEKIVIFDWNHCLSRKWYEIGPWLLRNALIGSRRWQNDMCLFRWPWVTVIGGHEGWNFQVDLVNNARTVSLEQPNSAG